MAKHNIAFLYGRVSKAPIINKNPKTGEYYYGMVYLDTVRSLREVGDQIRYTKHDFPLIMTKKKEHLDQMCEWKENDIVYVKGVITTKKIPKTSFCPDCKDENGRPFANAVEGNLVYVTPIYINKITSFGEDKEMAVDHIIENREISNQAYVSGTLIRDPKLFTTSKGLQITQYPIAVNRKFYEDQDEQDMEYRTDWPMVKSYGDNARGDRIQLQAKAEVLIDGFLQARTVTRKITCKCCGKQYEFKDQSMELVPYEVEYLNGYKSQEEIRAESEKTIEELKQKLFNSGKKEEPDPDDVDSHSEEIMNEIAEKPAKTKKKAKS